MIKAIIFDMDGVLVDSEKIHFKAEKIALNKYGITRTKKEELAFTGVPFETALKIYIKENNIPPEKFKIIINEKQKLMEKFENEIKLIPSTYNFIKNNYQKFRFALVTSSNRITQHEFIRKFKLGKYFKVLLSCNDIKNPKPHPDPYIKAIKKLKVKKDECFVIEDSLAGITAAKRAGIFCVGLAGTFPISKLEIADKIIKRVSYNSLRQIIDKNA
jgi:beta-phosphoglucomutase